MPYSNRTKTSMEDGEFNINPEPVPYQPQNFMQPHLPRLESSTLLKKVPIPKRHLDSFGGYEYSLGSKRGVILHTDRYQWDAAKSIEGMSQRDRLRAELEYMERLRGVKRRREMLPHRAQLDLLMGGKKVEFSERFDIQKEIQKLKSLIMPQNARDLFHGRGFVLPEQHSSIRPRKPPILDYDSDEDNSAPSSLHRLGKQVVDPDTGLPKSRLRQSTNQLPRILNRNVIGDGSPLLLSKEKRTVDQIKARISIPAGMTPAYLKRSRTNIQSKFESTMNRSMTVPDGSEKALKFTTKAETVKRVEIPSAGTISKAKAAEKVEPVTEPAVDLPPMEIDTDLNGDLPEEDIAALERIESRLSGRSKVNASPIKAPTPNPLKGSELQHILPEAQRNELKQAFKELDTDADGHLLYQQVKSQLPPQMSPQQERFLKQVYDITSSSTFFGIDEFMTMSTLTTMVQNLKEEAASSFSKIDFASLHNQIIKYVDLFQTVDRSQRGKISLDSLQEILSNALEMDLTDKQDIWDKIIDTIDPNEGVKISKIEFLAHIPYFLSLQAS